MRNLPHDNRRLRLVPDLPPSDDSGFSEADMKAMTQIIPMLGPESDTPYVRPTNIPPEQYYPVQPSHIRTLCGAVGLLMRRRHADPAGRMLEVSPRYVPGADRHLAASRPWVGGNYYETDTDVSVHLSLSVLTGNLKFDRWQSELIFCASKFQIPGQPDPAKAVRFRDYLDAGQEVLPDLSLGGPESVTVYQARAVFSMLRSAIGFGDGIGDYGPQRIPPIPETELPYVFETLDLKLLEKPIFGLPPKSP